MAQTEETPLTKAEFTNVGDVLPGTHGQNLKVKVISRKVVLQRTENDYSKLVLGEALVGDNTGCIILTARNAQLKALVEGQTFELRNIRIEMFKANMRIVVDQWGKVEPAKTPLTGEVNKQNNMSTVEYELIEVDNGHEQGGE